MATLISIIVPVFNEEDNVEPTYRKLKHITDEIDGFTFEFIFTDNHSTDRTFEMLLKIARADQSVRVVRYSRNFGFEKSVLTGYRLARGAAAIQIDADLEDPPELIADFLAKWREGYDVVVGIRRARMEPQWLQQTRRFYYRLLARLDGPHLIADAGDFRLVDASIIEMLRRIDDAHPYLRGLVSSLARNQTGIEYDRSKRIHGKSKFPVARLVDLGMHGILTHSRAPLKLAFYAGIFASVVAMVFIVVFISSRLLWSSEWPAGLATTLILILVGIGLNGLFMGIMGAYLGRVYDQVRHRPTTIISQAINFGVEAGQIDPMQPGAAVAAMPDRSDLPKAHVDVSDG